MSAVLPTVAYQLGVGGIGGFIIGFTVETIRRIIVVLLGLFAVFLLYLGTSGIISINYEELWHALPRTLYLVGQMAEWLISLISLLPFMGSFIAGFVFGFKLG